MAPVLDLEAQRAVDLGAHVAGVVRHLGERGERVEPRHLLGERQDAARALGDLAAQAIERLELERDAPLVGAEDLGLVVGELGGDVALGVGERLLAHVVGRHAVEVGARDLEVVAEDAVVADLERADAGALALAHLDLQDLALAALGEREQLVELGGEAAAHEAAVAPLRRRIVGERVRDLGGDVAAQRLVARRQLEELGMRQPRGGVAGERPAMSARRPGSRSRLRASATRSRGVATPSVARPASRSRS